MKIGIIGTRGIPNYYGGFEQFAEYLSVDLVKAGHEVFVYNSHSHPFQESIWNGVNIVHCNDPEDKIGTAGQFIYDLNCILDSRKRNYDIILQLGYTSSSIWGWLLPSKSIIVTNMDGLEWKRSKYSKPVQKFLQFAEYLGVKFSDYLIADSVGIQSYLKEKYKKESAYIPYGAHVFNTPDESILTEFNVEKYNYSMLIARMEPENSIETILDGVVESNNNKQFLVIGNAKNKFGLYLQDKFKAYNNIIFVGPVYNLNKLNNLRYFSTLYFHGHTVGGTNPSLLEAMASNALICAHDNIFNKSILKENAFYFKSSKDISQILSSIDKTNSISFVNNNINEINEKFTWNKINGQYIELFVQYFNI